MIAKVTQDLSHTFGLDVVAEVGLTDERMLGAGDMPVELDRFSWGAYLLPLIWSLRYLVWQAILVFLASGVALLAIRYFTSRASTVAHAVTLGLDAFLYSYAVWLGTNGNRLAWRSAARRVARGSSEPTTVAGVLRGQKWWIGFGAAFMLLNVLDVCRSVLLGVEAGRVEAGALLVMQIASLVVALILSHGRSRPTQRAVSD